MKGSFEHVNSYFKLVVSNVLTDMNTEREQGDEERKRERFTSINNN